MATLDTAPKRVAVVSGEGECSDATAGFAKLTLLFPKATASARIAETLIKCAGISVANFAGAERCAAARRSASDSAIVVRRLHFRFSAERRFLKR
jgi:hypothetical protein